VLTDILEEHTVSIFRPPKDRQHVLKHWYPPSKSPGVINQEHNANLQNYKSYKIPSAASTDKSFNASLGWTNHTLTCCLTRQNSVFSADLTVQLIQIKNINYFKVNHLETIQIILDEECTPCVFTQFRSYSPHYCMKISFKILHKGCPTFFVVWAILAKPGLYADSMSSIYHMWNVSVQYNFVN